jgi:serine/threonine protein kinase
MDRQNMEPFLPLLLLQMCNALDYLHNYLYVAHLDLKLENFLVQEITPSNSNDSSSTSSTSSSSGSSSQASASSHHSSGPNVVIKLADFGYATKLHPVPFSDAELAEKLIDLYKQAGIAEASYKPVLESVFSTNNSSMNDSEMKSSSSSDNNASSSSAAFSMEDTKGRQKAQDITDHFLREYESELQRAQLIYNRNQKLISCRNDDEVDQVLRELVLERTSDVINSSLIPPLDRELFVNVELCTR